MPLFRCPCGFQTDRKGNLRDHINRKDPCEKNRQRQLVLDDLRVAPGNDVTATAAAHGKPPAPTGQQPQAAAAAKKAAQPQATQAKPKQKGAAAAPQKKHQIKPAKPEPAATSQRKAAASKRAQGATPAAAADGAAGEVESFEGVMAAVVAAQAARSPGPAPRIKQADRGAPAATAAASGVARGSAKRAAGAGGAASAAAAAEEPIAKRKRGAAAEAAGQGAAQNGPKLEQLQQARAELKDCADWLKASAELLQSVTELQEWLERLKKDFAAAKARGKLCVPTYTQTFENSGELRAWLQSDKPDWSCGAIKLCCSDYNSQAQPKLQAILTDAKGKVGNVGCQVLPKGPKDVLGSWEDSEMELSPVAFQEAAQEVGKALGDLWARAAPKLDAKRNDLEAFACFVEALLPLAPAGLFRPLYAPLFDIGAAPQGGKGRSPATVLDGYLPVTDPDEDPEIMATDADFAARFANCVAWSGTALSLGDQGLAGACRRIMPGISQAVGIASMVATSALLHVEDMGFGSWNIHLHGDPKVWYVVAPSKTDAFLQELATMYPDVPTLTASFCKQMLPRLSAEQMEQLGVSRIVQLPGEVVLTRPGLVFHWTISTGFSFAESTNYFLELDGYSLADACADFNAHQDAVIKDAKGLSEEWEGLRNRATDRRRDITAVLYSVLKEGVPGLAKLVAAARKRMAAAKQS